MSGISTNFISKHAITPPAWLKFLSPSKVAVPPPPVSVYPYASKNGIPKAFYRYYFTAELSGAAPEPANFTFPPRTLAIQPSCPSGISFIF